ncbi:4'-phosphopantetheinyl transferase family protein [Acerihabitans arboris]|uniref:Enterobactin synthase component D n=1 Tax=Acerihabitans arboris TaxID=2691583 RepID=A0A845SQ27_9GAMM|nr:4'-phosphopantetheinyl transferase superfamily protein [Acerihabitans arboris]NDL65462.1 4'-phosphopantetheinyl transferase superfamily protein [Acerihabitans arboris]
MSHPVSCILSLEQGLPFGSADLLTLPARAWCCRFDIAFYQDEDFAAQGVRLPLSIAGAAVKRRGEYLAGRIVAGRVLADLGYPRFDLLPGEDRAPAWPDTVQGALTHHATLAICIGWRRPARPVSGLGIDIETLINGPRTLELWPGIISVWEREYFATLDLPFAVSLTLAFSAKESLFKALYPLVNRYFDFLDARVVRLADNRITLELLVELTPALPVGRLFECGYAATEHDVLTVLAIGND